MDHNFKDILHNVNLTEGQISVILCSLESVSYTHLTLPTIRSV